MVLSAEQERVRSLIADTVSLLCKNGLHYTKEFSIEGLLGITLDRDEVFLVNINEIVKTDLGKEDSESGSGTDDESVPKSPSSRRRKRKRNRKATAEDAELESDNETNSSAQANFDEPSNKNIKQEDDDSGDDLVFVKNEPGILDNRNSVNFSDQSSNNILGNLSQHGQLYATPTSNPLPGPSWDSSNSSFNQNLLQQQPPSSQGGIVSPQQLNQQQQQTAKAKSANPVPPPKYICLQCGKSMSSRRGFQYHMNMHQGIFPYYCPYCSKGLGGTSNLKHHMVEHVGKFGFFCIDCTPPEEFPDFRNLRKHLLEAHGRRCDFDNPNTRVRQLQVACSLPIYSHSSTLDDSSDSVLGSVGMKSDTIEQTSLLETDSQTSILETDNVAEAALLETDTVAENSLLETDAVEQTSPLETENNESGFMLQKGELDNDQNNSNSSGQMDKDNSD